MIAIRVHEVGGPEVMRLEEIARPVPARGEVLVEIEAAGLNFIDIYQRTGFYKVDLPFTPGQEGAGVVTAVGPEVDQVKVGDRVAWAVVLGAYAEYAVVPASRVAVLPEGVTAREGAALMVQGMTAHYLASSTYPLRAGDSCLVHAAAGGVGLLLCQIAHRRGARVIATVSTEAKAELAREAFADEVILYERDDFEAAVKRLTGGAGVKVVYDSVGRTTFERSLRCLAPRGYLVFYGQSSGPVPPLDPLLLSSHGSLFVTRPVLNHYIATREDLLARANELFAWIRDGTLRLRIGLELPLAEAAEAHRRLAGRQTTGKVLLVP